MGYRIHSNITCLKRRCYVKYWTRSSLIKNLLNVKHHAPYKSMYSKYQIIGVLENCFQNMNYFFSKYELLFLDQANSSSDPSQLLMLKFPKLELPCLPDHVCHILP